MSKSATPPPPHVLVEAEPFIPYMKEENFSPLLEPVLAPYKKRMGFLPNALKFYAHRPEIAATLWALNSNVMRDPSSTLDQFLKRKLAVVCCAINGCAYCTAHSCTMLKAPRGAGSEGLGPERTGIAGPGDRRRSAGERVRARLLRLRARRVGRSDLGAG